MIEDTLDLSRIEHGKFDLNMELFDLHAVIREVTEIMRFQIEQKKLRLEVNILPSAP